MVFESAVVPAMILILYKGKGEKTECINYRGLISVLREVGKYMEGS